MATISPIQYALGQVGQNLSGILQSEAERRRTALAEQQQVNQLSLQQATLANQARVEEGKLGVSLAEVGMRGRQFERQGELEAERNRIAQATQQSTAQYQTGSLGVANRQADIAAATQQSTAKYQQGTLAQQGAQLTAMKPVYAAQARSFTADADRREQEAGELRKAIQLGETPVDPAQMLGSYQQLWSKSVSPEYAQMMTDFTHGYLTATHPDLAKLPKGPNGQPLYPQSHVNKIIEQMEPLGKLYVQNKMKAAVPLDQQIKIVTESFGKLSETQQQRGLPAYMMEVLPMFKNLEGYNMALRTLENQLEGKGGVREVEMETYRKEHGLRPNATIPPDSLKKIDKAVDLARTQMQKQIQSQIMGEEDVATIQTGLQGQRGTPAPTPTVTPPQTEAPSLAQAAVPTARAGTPEYVVHLYRRGHIPQPEALQTLQTTHGLNEDQALTLMYPTPEAAVTDAVRGRKTPPIDPQTIRAAVQQKRIVPASGVNFLMERFGVTRERAREFLETGQ